MSQFKDRLTSLGFNSYDEYLESSHWANFKERYRTSGLPMRCRVCDASCVQLHHHTYIRLGAEELTDVTPLCRKHHVAVHEWLRTSGRVYVSYTHEAVVALGGVAVEQPKRRFKTAAEGKAFGLMKRGQRRAAKKAIGKSWAKKLVPKDTPKEELLRRIFALPHVSNKQKKRIEQYVASDDVAQLRGFLVGALKQGVRQNLKKESKMPTKKKKGVAKTEGDKYRERSKNRFPSTPVTDVQHE